MTLPDFSEEKTARERAVSDAIAFTLTFSIIMVGIGALTVTATDRVSTFSEAQRIDSAEGAMQSFGGTIGQMEAQGDQNRSLGLALKGGNIRFRESRLQVSNTMGVSANQRIDAIEHEFTEPDQDVRFTYSGGAVTRTRGSDGIVLEQPNFVCREDQYGDKIAIVSLVQLTTGESINRGATEGSGLRLDEYAVPSDAPITSSDTELNLQARITDVETATDSGPSANDLSVRTNGVPNEDAWNETFEELSDESAWEYPETIGASGGYLQCEDPDTTVFRKTTIELTIEEL